MKYISILALLLFPFIVRAQIINTIAGNGSSTFSGDGGAAISAGIYNPSGGAYDNAGNLYISDCDHHRIRKVTPAGVISTFAGTGVAGFSGDGGPASAAKLNRPVKLHIDAANNIYVADFYNNRIRKIDASGIITTVAGNGSIGFSGDGGMATAASLYNPSDVAFDLSGNMYVCDYVNWRVRKVTPGGIISTYAGTGVGGYSGDGGPATNAKIYQAFGIAMDGANNLYIADAGNQRVRKVTPAGIISTVAGTGTASYSGDGGLAVSAGLNNPAGINIDAYGNMYIADQFNYRIRKVTTAGFISTVAGNGINGFSGDGGPATNAQLSNTNETTISPAGNLVICDDANNRVRMVTLVTPCDTIVLADTIHVCSGTSVSLNAHMSLWGIPDYTQWSPTTGLSSPTTLTPTLTAGPSSGWYHITTSTLLPGNLVTNGDFSAGNTGFSSSYIYAAGPSSTLYEGYYSVYNNPNGVHSVFTSFNDHTSGTGNMLIINGAGTPVDVWCQTITVSPNTNYDLSAWIANCSSITTGAYVPILQFKINGVLVGSSYTVSSAPGVWSNFHTIWNSGTTTSATLCIYNLLTTTTGNDFAIDDIQLRPVCTATDSIYVAINPPTNIHRAKDTTVCTLTTHTLTAPAGHTNYIWNTGSTATSITVSGWGPYWVSSDSACTHFVDTFTFHPSAGTAVNLGSDTSLCNGSTLNIGIAPVSGTSFLWNTGSTASTITVSSAGTYWLQATNAIGCTSSDTIHISVGTIGVSLGNDTSTCTGTSVAIAATGSYTAPVYLWNTGSSAPSISVSTPGNYWLQVTATGCTATDTLRVDFFPPVYANLGNDTVICKLNGSVVLTSAQTEGVYSTWSTGSTTDTIHVATAGNYWVEVDNHGCKTTDSIYINIVDSPYAIPYIKPDLCVNDTTTLRIADESGNIEHYYYWNYGGATVLNTSVTDTAGPFTVKWTDSGTYIISLSVTTPEGCKSDTAYDTVHVHPLPVAGIIDTNHVTCANDEIILRASVTDPGYFYTWLPSAFFDDPYAAVVTGHVLYSADVTLIVSTSLGCKAETFVNMQADSCCLLTMPAGFTPNNDGHNDLFRPITKQNVVIEQFRIFNRWGNCVFESNVDNAAWDGSYKGEKQDMNVFYYYIKYTCSGAKRMQKGEVTLVR
jgi:gliding motility-associated-like protein